MTARRSPLLAISRGLGRVAALLGFAAGVVLLMLWLAGKFEPKVPLQHEPDPPTPVSESQAVAARSIQLPIMESAVGSIRAVHETSIGSKLLARVVEVNLKAGQPVHPNDVLLRLDDSDLRAKFQQAKATLAAAEAVREQAAADDKREQQLLQANATTKQDYEKAATALRSADADLQHAREAVNEVQATLDWATVRSPFEGVVIDKKVDVGDMVAPGQLLVTLFDPKRMQLIANVRESLAHRLQVGQEIAVQLQGLDKRCSGEVSEIVPQAQSASRAFQVKVTGPCPTGVYTGMFGRILIPLEDERIVVIPRRTVRNVGQLELVDVIQDGQIRRRSIRTGRVLGNDVEILSGLREGELVRLPSEPAPTQEAIHG